jgi:tetratricopeptide (TPR) repeat protein
VNAPANSRLLIIAVIAVCFAILTACTPQAQLLLAVLPEGTIPILLGNLEKKLDEKNGRRIKEYEQRQDWAGLAQFADENLAKDKSNSSWWLVAGYAQAQQRQYARAIECFQEVVRLAPDEPEGWNLLAQSYRESGRPERAVSTLENALQILRESPVTAYLLGESYTDLRRYGPAVNAYRQAIQYDGGFVEAWAGLGRAYARSGRINEARDVARGLEKPAPALADLVKREIAAAEGSR